MSKRLLLTGFFIIGLHALASAQPAATRPPGTRDVSVDPIRCWWRTSTGTVRIGETPVRQAGAGATDESTPRPRAARTTSTT